MHGEHALATAISLSHSARIILLTVAYVDPAYYRCCPPPLLITVCIGL